MEHSSLGHFKFSKLSQKEKSLLSFFNNLADIEVPFKIGGYGGPKEPETFHSLYSFVLNGQGLERLNIFAPKINNHLLGFGDVKGQVVNCAPLSQ